MGLLNALRGAAVGFVSGLSRGAAPAAPVSPSAEPDEGIAKRAGNDTPATSVATGSTAGLREAMQQGNPGAWSSDHRAEAQRYTGWNYIAIDALATQAQQAEVCVYDDGTSQVKNRAKRRVWREMLAKSQITKAAYQDQATEANLLEADHPLVRLLKRPNPKQSGASFNAERIIQLRLTGQCLVWNVPNALGRTVERYVIPTAVATPEPPSARLPQGGWSIDGGMLLRYQISLDAMGFAEYGSGLMRAAGAIIPAEFVQVIRLPHPIFKDDGYSPLSACSLQSDVAEMTDRSRWAGLKNGGNPDMMIAVPDGWNGDQAELDQIEVRLNEKLSGVKNNRRVVVGTFGEIIKASFNGREMDYANTYPQIRDAVLAIHGTPGIAAGMMGEHGSYAALYATLTGWSMLRVQPTLDLLADEDTETLAPQFGKGLTIELAAMAINDPDILEKQLATEISGGGIRTVDEIRALRGLKPFGDERGERIFGAVVPVAEIDPETGKPIPPDEMAGDEDELETDTDTEGDDEPESESSSSPSSNGRNTGRKGPPSKKPSGTEPKSRHEIRRNGCHGNGHHNGYGGRLAHLLKGAYP